MGLSAYPTQTLQQHGIVPTLALRDEGESWRRQPFRPIIGAPVQQQFPQPFIQQQQQQQPGPFIAPPPQQQQQQQQQPQLQISQPSDPAFQALPVQQPQPQLAAVASGFTPSIAFQPQQPFNANNNLVPNILPIGNIPLQPHPTQIHQLQQPQQQQQQQQQQAPRPTAPQQQGIVPSLPGPAPGVLQPIAPNPPTPPAAPLPAQFALSSNTLQHQHHQQRHFLRQGKTIVSPQTDSVPSSSSHSESVIDCGSGNDLGFCATSEKYPR
ncbi:hypothetical protein DAPPUDRAFT_95777 [Daphnia pulex]|uniref:Uncharacterized protein n=1 Tax=Daphnia pulex TaxID=6669 RepID=E9FUR0_DAPPU|nr:hypothetical protein DAPPUDRAFT_95777 [Daphnia pulex]|eukprot:EFX88881.1 hypothetical protein DAPPUDRAFT_95777 [Daphnia pulex]